MMSVRQRWKSDDSAQGSAGSDSILTTYLREQNRQQGVRSDERIILLQYPPPDRHDRDVVSQKTDIR